MREIPSISYPQDNYIAEGCRVQILVSCEAWAMRRSDQCEWQIAHECVHLLDPVKRGRANVLEEGLAFGFRMNCDSTADRYNNTSGKTSATLNTIRWPRIWCSNASLGLSRQLKKFGDPAFVSQLSPRAK